MHAVALCLLLLKFAVSYKPCGLLRPKILFASFSSWLLCRHMLQALLCPTTCPLLVASLPRDMGCVGVKLHCNNPHAF